MFCFVQVILFESWDKLSWKVVCTWQWTINTSDQDEEKVSSNWFKEFLKNSCATTLCGQLNAFYDKLVLCFKGATACTYYYVMSSSRSTGIPPLL